MATTIVCYGDSNTFGADMSRMGGRFSENERWPMVMARELGSGYDIREEGLNGRTAATDDSMMGHDLNGLKSLPGRLAVHAPVGLLIIMLGTNDVKEKYGLSPRDITQNMARLIHAAKDSGALSDGGGILLIAPAPIGELVSTGFMGPGFGAGCVGKSEALAGLYRELADSEGCYFLDAAEYISVGTTDYVHLSAEGHLSLGKTVAEFIKTNGI